MGGREIDYLLLQGVPFAKIHFAQTEFRSWALRLLVQGRVVTKQDNEVKKSRSKIDSGQSPLSDTAELSRREYLQYMNRHPFALLSQRTVYSRKIEKI